MNNTFYISKAKREKFTKLRRASSKQAQSCIGDLEDIRKKKPAYICLTMPYYALLSQ